VFPLSLYILPLSMTVTLGTGTHVTYAKYPPRGMPVSAGRHPPPPRERRRSPQDTQRRRVVCLLLYESTGKMRQASKLKILRIVHRPGWTHLQFLAQGPWNFLAENQPASRRVACIKHGRDNTIDMHSSVQRTRVSVCYRLPLVPAKDVEAVYSLWWWTGRAATPQGDCSVPIAGPGNT
jgi:hypothetical protein